MFPLTLFLNRIGCENIHFEETFLDWSWHFPIFKRHDLQHNILSELQILLAVGAKLEFETETLDVQVRKARFEEPLIE